VTQLGAPSVHIAKTLTLTRNRGWPIAIISTPAVIVLQRGSAMLLCSIDDLLALIS
jgi:hypothetical protein